MNKLSLLFSTLLLMILFFTGCGKITKQVHEEKVDVMVSILPLVEFVEKVGGDKVNVEEIIPPGYEPHSYEMTPSQLEDVSNADIYIKAGHIEFEQTNMDKIVEQNLDMLVIDGSQGIQLRKMKAHSHGHEEGTHADDPHTWLSVNNAKIYVDNIYNALVELDPDNQDYYKSNKLAYEKELNEVDEVVTQTLNQIVNKKIIVYHPAFGYFLNDYGFEQIPIEIEGKEPTAVQLEELIFEAKHENIKIIFVQKQFSTENAETVADEIEGIVVQVDPLAKNFINNLENISHTIVSNQ